MMIHKTWTYNMKKKNDKTLGGLPLVPNATGWFCLVGRVDVIVTPEWRFKDAKTG
jgi:hypothetical protein